MCIYIINMPIVADDILLLLAILPYNLTMAAGSPMRRCAVLCSGRPDAAGRVASSHGRGESAGPRASGVAPCGGEAGGCLASWDEVYLDKMIP